jgi:hypothetical protein
MGATVCPELDAPHTPVTDLGRREEAVSARAVSLVPVVRFADLTADEESDRAEAIPPKHGKREVSEIGIAVIEREEDRARRERSALPKPPKHIK